MKTRLAILAIIMAAIMAFGLIAVPNVKAAAIPHGPRVNSILISIFSSGSAEVPALEAGTINLVDWPLGPADIATIQSSYPNIQLDSVRQNGMMEFDINNNLTMLSYPNFESPTADLYFREAMAYLCNKTAIIATAVGGYGTPLDTPIFPWTDWYDPAVANYYTFNPTQAITILHAHGWTTATTYTPGTPIPVVFPAGWPSYNGAASVAGKTLASVMTAGPSGGSGSGLIFYRRSDDPERSQAGLMFEQWLESAGIPCYDLNVVRAVTSGAVMYEKDFNVYTGGWTLSIDPTYVYSLWDSAFIDWNINDFAWNYDNINNTAWDAAITALNDAPTLAAADTAGKLACDIFVQNEFFIPLWAPTGYYATSKPWNVLNAVGVGVPSWWNLYCTNNPTVGVTGGTLNWGFASDVQALNVIDSQWVWDWQILSELYDSLIASNPLNPAVDVPWLASSWTVGTWLCPNSFAGGPATCTKLSYTLNPNNPWIVPGSSGGAISSLGNITTTDVVFSILYTYLTEGWNFGDVYNCYANITSPGTTYGMLSWYTANATNAGPLPFVTVSGETVTVYMNILSVWAEDLIGGLPIIPKALFEPIQNPVGFTPGYSTLNMTMLTGSGPFYLTSYTVGGPDVLTANRLYFKTVVPNTDYQGSSPTPIKIAWGIFLSNCKAGDWTVNVLDLIVVASFLGWHGKPGDIPADVNRDGVVNVLDLITVATDLNCAWVH